MYETMTPEALKAAMLGEINESHGLSSMAGGFADGVIGPVAEQMSNIYISLDAVPDMLFVTADSGQYIDKVGQQYYNITRRPGTRAYCGITLTGTPGLVIAQGTQFLTASGLAYTLMETVTLPQSGTAVGRLESGEVGAAYNVEAGAIDRMYINLAGLTGYTNGAAAGGTDPESDTALLNRIKERVQQPATSGNGYQYRQWAMAVAGVGQAKVVELADGPGTVGLIIVSSSYEAHWGRSNGDRLHGDDGGCSGGGNPDPGDHRGGSAGRLSECSGGVLQELGGRKVFPYLLLARSGWLLHLAV